MPKPLVIVESPAKAKTIAGFLGKDYVVESSIGHIRDLPARAAEVPAAYKGESWARLGIDVDNDFKPLYIVPPGRAKEQVRKLKELVKDASEIYLATDEDREGESIAWHLLEVLGPRVPVKRMVFHEITKVAIERAVDEWRELNLPLVDAQETRRLLDRLYGYEVSPVLWKKVMPRLSAGRVQSVATRMIVERERERMRFRAAGWWDIEGVFAKGDEAGAGSFGARLHSVDGRRVADAKSFDESGQLTDETRIRLDEEGARGLAARLADAAVAVRSVEQRPHTERPKPPFITSTLQQAAGSKMRWSSRQTMQVAQRLYENGYITYMRTDSTTLSETALKAARDQARRLYGAEYTPDAPRHYAKKVKNAQEAHEAIRPAGDSFKTPEQVAGEVGGDEARLYDLIWRRTVASQMKDATGQRTTVRLGAASSSGEDVEFSTSGTVITFAGFRRAYGEGADDSEAADEEDRRLPSLTEGDALEVRELNPEDHSTSPPNRYTEASLVKAMEELGVGRPSTYASIIGTIQDRGYVWKKGSALIPTWTAFAVTNLLEQHFPRLVDYRFTASLEDDLDAIARREEERVPWLRRFYFGNGTPGLKSQVSEHLDQIDAKEISTIPLGTGSDGQEIVVRVGKYGPYLARGDDKASIRDDVPPDELTIEQAEELLAAPSGDRTLGDDPATGLPVLARAGRYGPYVQLGELEPSSKDKPRTASLFKTMSLESLSLDEALQLLTLPRVLGTDPADGAEVLAANGKYGPYVKKGKESRSVTDGEEKLLTISLDEALALLAQPKQGRGRQSAPPLRELGDDPATGTAMVIKDGRFGPYITDGKVNVTVPKSEQVETISSERAAELLAEKRAKGPTKPTKPKRGSRKKAS